jgi:hypothetical protein
MFKQKLNTILRSLALDVEPKRCISIYSRSHIKVTNGFEIIPSIYNPKTPKLIQYKLVPLLICYASNIAAIIAIMIE